MASYGGRLAPLAICALGLVLPVPQGPEAFAAPAQGVDPACAGPEEQVRDDDDGDGDCSEIEQAAVVAQENPGTLYSSASAALRTRDVARAVQAYRGIVDSSPKDGVALMYLAGWSNFLKDEGIGNDDDVDRYTNRLEEVDPARGADLGRMIAAISAQRGAQITEDVPEADDLRGAGTTIVALGAGLRPDGTMPDVLVGRLMKTLQVARADEDASIIVTGGKPQNGLAEADAMADWLAAQGVDPARIHKEDRSTSTVQNALNSAEILRSLRPEQLVVVTSANHVRRASALFELVAETVLDPGFELVSVASVDPAQTNYDEAAAPEPWELRAIYRDSFSVVRPGM